MEKEFYARVFEEVLRLTNDGFIVVDDKAVVIDINDSYSSFLGRKKEDIVGNPITDFIPNSKMADIMKNEYKEELVLHKYQPGYIKDSANDFVLVSRTYVKDSGGNIIGGVAQVHFREQAVSTARRMIKEYNELEFLREQYKLLSDSQPGLKDIIGKSDIILNKKREAMQAAKTNFPVLITGESGTGKEVFARIIHCSGHRRGRPFVGVNCAAIPSELLESELFGYEEGAFTGAKKGGKKGKFIQADGGTIFLDEIGDMPLLMQAKILRILQEKEVDTIGGSAPIPVDVRIISATRRNLEQMVEDGTFREDLYYRLNVINLHLPPLRSRVEDIPPLVQYFIDKLNEEYKLNVEIDKEVIEAFCNYSWHGNVRELENVIKGAYAVCDGLEIISTDLPAKFGMVVTDKLNVDKKISFGSSEKNIDALNIVEEVHSIGSMKKYLAEKERDIVLSTYERFRSVRKAAEYLGMSMPTYARKLQFYRD